MRKLVIAAITGVLLAGLIAGPAVGATSDPYRSRQWGLDKIQAEQAWTTADGTGAVIAVVDTGVDLGHPDLAAKIIGNGADFTGDKKNDGAQDENGHGTHAAGIAAAITNNGVGVAGTAPGAQILPVRVLDAEGSGSTDQVAEGIRWAADNGADVISLSLGVISGVGTAAKLIGELDSVYAAIDYAWSKGAVVAIAAGNDSFPLCAEPAANPNAICVGATDQNDLPTFYSNTDPGVHPTFVRAPGGGALTCSGDIFSTYLRSAQQSTCSPQAGYDALAGTSMATPFVSGVAALLVSKGLTNAQIVSCFKTSSDDLGLPGRDPIYGYGRINAQRAVTTC